MCVWGGVGGWGEREKRLFVGGWDWDRQKERVVCVDNMSLCNNQ